MFNIDSDGPHWFRAHCAHNIGGDSDPPLRWPRTMIRTLIVGLLLLAATSVHAQPTVLFLSVDDLNAFPIGGHPDVIAPNLDRLAAAGVSFTNAQAPSPACNPSRVATFTGISPLTSGIYYNSQHDFRTESSELTNAVTLFQHFKNHGYQLVGTGKLFHRGFDLPDTAWDSYVGFTAVHFPDPARFPLNGIAGVDVNGDGTALLSTFDWGSLEAPGEPDITSETIEYVRATWAAERILEPHPAPVFIAVGFSKPHIPWYVPQQTAAIRTHRALIEGHVNRLRKKGGKQNRLCCSIRHAEGLWNA